MDISKINEIMASRGYSNFVGAIFQDWEFVKDEVLLPNRKIGSGNGTSHIYLLEDNMTIFRKCFGGYLDKFSANIALSEDQCPHITHYVMTANVLTVAGFAYSHYQYDSNIFNYSDYVNKVMQHDNNGLVEFESLFKLSTENRPYLKQFDKLVFGKIIRYLFVPQLSAYKIFLYSDDSNQNYATFWVIGQVQEGAFIADKSCENKISTPPQIKPKMEVVPAKISVEDLEARFVTYMKNIGKSNRTVSSYLLFLKTHLPQKIQEKTEGYSINTLFDISNIEQLEILESTLWSNSDICEWNSKSHNSASAALHMYMSFIEGMDSSVVVEHSTSIVKNANALTAQEDDQKEKFATYLKRDKQMSDVTVSSYISVLQKHMTSVVLEAGYIDSKANFFSVKDYATIISINNAIWTNPTVYIKTSLRNRLSAAFKAYMEFVESDLSDEELAEIVFTNSIN